MQTTEHNLVKGQKYRIENADTGGQFTSRWLGEKWAMLSRKEQATARVCTDDNGKPIAVD